jgi:hypothetical protein
MSPSTAQRVARAIQRWHEYDGKTFKEIGTKYGISAQKAFAFYRKAQARSAQLNMPTNYWASQRAYSNLLDAVLADAEIHGTEHTLDRVMDALDAVSKFPGIAP